MKNKPQSILGKAIALGVLLTALTTTSRAVVLVTFDDFKVAQSIANTTATSSNSSVIISPAAFGTRALMLSNSEGDNPGAATTLAVITNTTGAGPRLSLSTDTGADVSYSVTWGTNGLNYNLGAPAGPSSDLNNWLSLNALYFDLRTMRPGSDFNWKFTDSTGATAEYTKSMAQVSPAANPAISYAMRLSDFTGASTFNWNSVNFLSLSGADSGNGLGFTLVNSIRIADVPEPGTWAAAALLLGVTALVRYRKVRSGQSLEAAVS